MEQGKSDIAANDILIEMIAAATSAGKAALAFFTRGGNTSAKVTMKTGDSPVTEADYAANAILVERLRQRWPEYGWISEEDADIPERLNRKRIFIADPIDGTRAFIAGKSEWCVSLGLIEDQKPFAGVIHLPVLGLTYAAAKGSGAYLNGNRLNVAKKTTLSGTRFAGPKLIFEELQKKSGGAMEYTQRVPSLAFRLVQVASGELDLAAASTGSHDWDIAAADIILQEAGAVLTDDQCQTLIYNRASLRREVLFAGHLTQVKLAS